MSDKTLEQRVAIYAARAAKFEKPRGNGLCWGFVHHVLAKVKAKSYYDYAHKKGEDPIFAQWGDPTDSPAQGYIVVLKQVEWITQSHELRGKGTVKSKVLVRSTHRFKKHVAVILALTKAGGLIIAQQGVPGKEAAPSVLVVPLKHLSKKGEIRFYRPEPTEG